MKLLQRARDSIRKNGFQGFLKILLSYLEDYIFDIRYGTDTMRWIDLNDLDIQSENRHRGVNYQPTRARPFRKLIGMLDFSRDSVFVDFGSGKGRVLLLASEYRFKRIVGIEFSHQLCEVARRNLLVYREKTGVGGNVEIVESDAVDYEVRDDENIFFFFNPFDAFVMNKVIRNIMISLEKKPRQIWLIYNCPERSHVIEKHRETLSKWGENVIGGHRFIIYVNQKRE